MITKTPIEIPEGYTEQQWAEQTPGVYMNMIAMAGKNPVDNKYHFAPIQYSDVNMEGEKVKYPDGREATVVFSCLAMEYKNKKEVYDQWWAKAKEVVKMLKEQEQIETYVQQNNIDLKKLRDQGSLEDKEEDVTE
jgi:hypothetical protein